MLSFPKRSDKKELLDGSSIPFEDIRQNMYELDRINHQLGGHTITLEGISSLIKNKSLSNASIRIVEIGCGGGDNLRVIKNWAKRHNLSVELYGVDYNKECIVYAESQERNNGIQFTHSNYKEAIFIEQPHIIFSSLFCHHFTDKELVFQLKWMQQNSLVGFFINDLHRHPLAYYSIKLITSIFSKSYLVKNDAPLSVKRGFVRKDWQRLFATAGINNYVCRWRWAFRWLVSCTSHAASH